MDTVYTSTVLSSMDDVEHTSACVASTSSGQGENCEGSQEPRKRLSKAEKKARRAQQSKERKQQQNNDEQRHNRKCGRQRRSMLRDTAVSVLAFEALHFGLKEEEEESKGHDGLDER